jgi:hypothetical protein
MCVSPTISGGHGSNTNTRPLEAQNAMLSQLQEWVSKYTQRDDAWSYRAHREIFDAFTGPKVEHRDLGAYPEMR